MKISRSITLIFRLLQSIVAGVVLALIGNMIATSGWNKIPRHGGNAAEVNFPIFIGLFSLLSMLYFIPVGWYYSTNKELLPITAGLDAFNTIFYMCGGIALAAALQVHSCSNSLYTTTNRITNSSPNTAYRCREAQAATAFIFFNFVTFAVSTLFSVLALLNAGEENPNPARRGSGPDVELHGGPAMAEEVPAPMDQTRGVIGYGGPHMDGSDLKNSFDGTTVWGTFGGLREAAPVGDHAQTDYERSL